MYSEIGKKNMAWLLHFVARAKYNRYFLPAVNTFCIICLLLTNLSKVIVVVIQNSLPSCVITKTFWINLTLQTHQCIYVYDVNEYIPKIVKCWYENHLAGILLMTDSQTFITTCYFNDFFSYLNKAKSDYYNIQYFLLFNR